MSSGSGPWRKAGFPEAPIDGPGEALINWHGTDACIDFECPACGAEGHLDSYDAWVLRCHSCRSLVLLGDRVTTTVVDEHHPMVDLDSVRDVESCP